MPQRRTVTSRSQEPRRRFAEEVRELRERSGVSLRQLAERLGWDWSTLGKLETGHTLGSPEVAQALDRHYGTPGLLLASWELAVGDPTQFKEQYRRYMLLEAEAASLWHFAVSILPGLLQADGYAREVLAAGGTKGEELAQQVEARVGRRALLVGEDAPPSYYLVPGRAAHAVAGRHGVEGAARTPRGDDRAPEHHASGTAPGFRPARLGEHRRDVPEAARRPDSGLHRDRLPRRTGRRKQGG